MENKMRERIEGIFYSAGYLVDLLDYKTAKIISLIEELLDGLTVMSDEEVGLIEWNSADLDMRFVDDHPKEVKALLKAQRDSDIKQIKERLE